MDSLTLKEKIKSEYMPRLRSFFEGRLYPVLIGALVVLGHALDIEIYLGTVNILIAAISLIICPTIKPFIVFFLTFIYQISKNHSPAWPVFSDYYFSGWRLIVVIILGVIIFSALGYFMARRVFPRLSLKSPLLLPLLLLSLSFILGGAFSDKWSAASLVYGACQAVFFFLSFYLFYYGLDGEDNEEIIDYLVYASLISALVIISELIILFLTGGETLIKDGAIIKEAVNLGFANSNAISALLEVSIPLLLLGAMRNKRRCLFYFTAATLTYFFSVITLSRNAMVFATLAFFVSIVIGCFFGEGKRVFRITAATVLVACILFAIIFHAKIAELVSEYFGRELDDTGRFDLWRLGFAHFLSNPIFGVGFFGFDMAIEHPEITPVGFLAPMAHCTPIQLLSAMGAIGLIAYGYYRVKTLSPLIRRPSYTKTMLYLPIFTVLFASLLDNFVFYFCTMFLYSVLLALLFRITDEERA